MRPATIVNASSPPAAPALTTSRRGFLAGAATVSWATGSLPLGGAFAAGQQRLRVGLVGCGGRGTGAALQAMQADASVRVVALGDVFADQVASAARLLEHRTGGADGQFDCPAARRFVGQDSYRHVLDSGVDVVLLAAPPHVRPLHFEAAVSAGKHVYCEKPVAIDAAGVVRVAAAAARSRALGLAVVSGFCFRRDARMMELVSRIHDGAIGRPLVVQAHAAIGLPWRQPLADGRPSADWRLRNWISFNRFSGGHLVDQHVQAIDRAVWILGDAAPLTVESMEYTQATADRAPGSFSTERSTGAIGDCRAFTGVRFVFPEGRVIEASIDRRERPRDSIVETVGGTHGICDLVRGTVSGPGGGALVDAPGPGRFSASMAALIGGILMGRVPNDGDTMCRSTLMAVMGREAVERAAVSDRPLPWNDITGGTSPLA